jgi:hypothetical protein
MFIPMWAIILFLLLASCGVFSDITYVRKNREKDPHDPDPWEEEWDEMVESD